MAERFGKHRENMATTQQTVCPPLYEKMWWTKCVCARVCTCVCVLCMPQLCLPQAKSFFYACVFVSVWNNRGGAGGWYHLSVQSGPRACARGVMQQCLRYYSFFTHSLPEIWCSSSSYLHPAPPLTLEICMSPHIKLNQSHEMCDISE